MAKIYALISSHATLCRCVHTPQCRHMNKGDFANQELNINPTQTLQLRATCEGTHCNNYHWTIHEWVDTNNTALQWPVLFNDSDVNKEMQGKLHKHLLLSKETSGMV